MMKTKRKALGQHFLVNPSIRDKIIRSISPRKTDFIIEVGAGKGALTFGLASRAGKIVAVEKDPSLIPYLKEKDLPNLVIVEGDILKIDLEELLERENFPGGKVKVVGNLPYSISSPLLFKILEGRDLFSECLFLLQKEVAERIRSSPCSKQFSPLSVMFQIFFDVRLLFSVGPESFSPPPKVQSALTFLKKRDAPLFALEDAGRFHAFLKKAFQQRRKTLFNNLKKAGLPDALVQESLARLSLDKKIRAEQLTIRQLVDLHILLFS